MNALGFVQQGLQAREQALQGQAQEGYRNALAQYGMNAPQTRSAFAAVNPVAANALQANDQERRDALIGRVAQSLAGMPPEQQAAAYPQMAQMLARSGIDLGPFQQYPGPDAIATAAALYGMPAAERSEFERLISSLPEGERGQAVRMRLGLEPDANMRLRVGAQQGERDPIAALRARASEAGLQPGTPEYTQFMIQGGAGSGFAVDVDPATGAVSVRQGAGAGQAQRPFTEGQSKDVVYATRAEGALAVLEPIAGSLASFGDRALDMDPTGAVRGQFQSEQYQVAKNAGDEFLQAILRKDTGAAITSQEQELYGATYLPRPGDGPAVLEQKAQARRRAISALRAGMSPAQMLAVERGLAEGGIAAPQADAPPPGVDPADWEFMSPEERALFGGSGAANPSEPAAAGDMVNRIAFVESGGRADARNPRSSATGLGQFIDGTWLEMVRRHRPELARGRSRDDVLALRSDPALSREMIARYAEDNARALVGEGFEPTPGNLYLAHFAGSGGALNVLRARPEASIESVLGERVVDANPFLRGKTAGWLVQWARGKMTEGAA